MKDLHNVVRSVVALAPVAIGTTGTGKAGKIIDLQGYGGVEFLFSYGAVTATNAVFTPVLMEGAATGTMTSVANADMIGSESLAGLAAGVRASGTTMNVTKRLGYKGNQRYVQVGKLSSTVTAATLVSVVALLHSPNVAATPNP